MVLLWQDPCCLALLLRFFCSLKTAAQELTGTNDTYQAIAGLLNIRVAEISFDFGCQDIDLPFLL
jgi:hypothetical protein